jgi:hypothetical protein
MQDPGPFLDVENDLRWLVSRLLGGASEAELALVSRYVDLIDAILTFRGSSSPRFTVEVADAILFVFHNLKDVVTELQSICHGLEVACECMIKGSQNSLPLTQLKQHVGFMLRCVEGKPSEIPPRVGVLIRTMIAVTAGFNATDAEEWLSSHLARSSFRHTTEGTCADLLRFKDPNGLRASIIPYAKRSHDFFAELIERIRTPPRREQDPSGDTLTNIHSPMGSPRPLSPPLLKGGKK